MSTMKNPGLEEQLIQKAAASGVPIRATLELTPCCNLQCRMCYVRHSASDAKQKGGILPVEYWEALIPELQELGILFISLIGGEPFVYPDLERLYTAYYQSGFYLNLTTNGVALADGLPDWLVQRPPRYMTVSIYGASDATYEAVTGDPRGFTKVMRAIQNLMDAKIPVKVSYIPQPDHLKRWKLYVEWRMRGIFR